MKDNDLLVAGGLIAAAYFLAKKKREEFIPIDQATTNAEPVYYGDSGVAPSKAPSEVNPGAINLTVVQPDGSLRTYQTDYEELTPYEKWGIQNNYYHVDPDGKLNIDPTKAVTAPVAEAVNSLRTKTVKNTNSAGVQQTVIKTPETIKVYTDSSTKPNMELRTKEVSQLDQQKIVRDIDSSGSITTYKGSTLQTTVGVALDKAKDKISDVSSWLRKKLRR